MKFWERYKIGLIVDSRDRYKEAVLSLLERNQKGLLMDLGCGDGRFTYKMAREIGTSKIYGIDKIGGVRNNIRFFQGDLNEDFSIDGKELDVVVASQVIEHLWNTDGFVKEIYRMLKPGGYAVISTPNLASWHNVAYLFTGRQPETATVSDELYPEKEVPGHRRVFTTTELVKLLQFHGFTIEKIIGTSYHPLIGKLAKLMCRLDRKHASMVTVKVRRSK